MSVCCCINAIPLRKFYIQTTMTDTVQQKTVRTLKDSAAMRWTALGVVAFTMMAAYYVNDVMAPLQEMLEAQLARKEAGAKYCNCPSCAAASELLAKFGRIEL